MTTSKETPHIPSWQTPVVLAAAAAVARDVEALRAENGDRQALILLQTQVQGSPDAMEQLRQFFLIVNILEIDGLYQSISPAAVQRLTDVARLILRGNHVPPTGSRLSFLHGRLETALAARDTARAEHWGALFRMESAAAHGHPETPPPFASGQSLQYAEGLLRLGAAESALAQWETLTRQEDHRTQAQAALVRIGRLAGRLDDAQRRIEDLALAQGAPHAPDSDLAWQLLMIHAQRRGNPAALVKETGRNRPQRRFLPLLTTHLWVHASGEPDLIAQMPRTRSFREMLGRGEAVRPLWEPVMVSLDYLEAASDDERHLPERLTALGQLAQTAGHAPDVEIELLIWAATARWLSRLHRPGLLPVVIRQYHDLCLKLTGGRQNDIYGCSPTGSSQAVVSTESGLKEHDFLRLVRAAQLASFSAGTMGTIMKGKVRRALSGQGKHAAIRAQEIEEHAERIKGFLRETKGAVLKIVQIAAFVDKTLPPPIAQVFKEVTTEPRAMDHTLSRRIIETELGRKLEEVFSEWNPFPVGIASLGQVHKARLKSGEQVAVKVQYPNMKAYIRQQLAAARMVAPLVQVLYPSAQVRRILEEVAEGLIGETDYQREAEFQERIRIALAGDSRIRIPRIFSGLSTGRIITMEFLDGIRIGEFARGVGQSEKNRAAETIVRANFELRFRHGIVNFDLHPGNFLFGPDYIGWVDFGNCSDNAAAGIEGFRRFYQAIRRADREEVIRLYQEFGFVGDPARFDFDAAYAQLARDYRPYYVDEPFRFTRDYTDNNFTDIAQNVGAWDLPAGWFGHFRAAVSLNTVLAELNAESNWHRLVAPILDAPPAQKPDSPAPTLLPAAS